MAYLEIDDGGLAFGFWGLEVLSINEHGMREAEADWTFEDGQLVQGGAFNLRLTTPWWTWSAWLDANGLQTYLMGAWARNTPLPFSELDEPTEADLAEAAAWLAIEELYDQR